MVYIYVGYFAFMNLLGLLLMFLDKQYAKRKMWRIPERVLFGTALLGGCIGGWLGMKLFRHKTKHALFAIGFPIVTILYVAAFLALWYFGIIAF